MEVISNPFMYAVAPPAPTRAPMSINMFECSLWNDAIFARPRQHKE